MEGPNNEGGADSAIPLGENCQNQSWFFVIDYVEKQKEKEKEEERRRLIIATPALVIAARIRWANLFLLEGGV